MLPFRDLCARGVMFGGRVKLGGLSVDELGRDRRDVRRWLSGVGPYAVGTGARAEAVAHSRRHVSGGRLGHEYCAPDVWV